MFFLPLSTSSEKNLIIHLIGLWKRNLALPVQVKPFFAKETVWCQKYLKKKNYIFTVTGANGLFSLNFPSRNSPSILSTSNNKK